MELDPKVEKTIFQILDNDTTNFEKGYEEFILMDNEVFKQSILTMIPAGKSRLRQYRFLFDVPADQFKLMSQEYYLILLAEEELQQLFN